MAILLKDVGKEWSGGVPLRCGYIPGYGEAIIADYLKSTVQ